ARRALAPSQQRSTPAPAPAPAGDTAPPRAQFALPPADADRAPRHDSASSDPRADHTPLKPHPVTPPNEARRAPEPDAVPTDPNSWAPGMPTASGVGVMPGGAGQPSWPVPGAVPGAVPAAEHPDTDESAESVDGDSDEGHRDPRAAQPLPEEAPVSADSTQGRAFSVRTLGQGVPFSQQITKQQNQTLAGRRRRLSPPHESHDSQDGDDTATGTRTPSGPTHGGQGGPLAHGPHSEGRAYAIGAPDEGAEGPQPLDGPGGAVEVANRPQPRPVDDELPPEPLDNPRRLLVWPAPDVSTQQALSDRGYRPVIVHSREEVDAQIAAFPAALFVDPLTGPITRTALQSLRQAAVAAEVPVLVTAGLGQATREAAYGADPAVLLKALAPRDSEQHPSRVLLIEESEEIALALTATLERRGMQVARAGTDSDAVTLASQMRPNLVVMDLMQVRRRRAGIIDWLRANGQLNRTPLVVYTSTGIDRAELPQLSAGETVLFLAERSTSEDVQARIVDLLAKIGTN
ncbi:hypothetical protein M877_20900, partial [Streptomyces niveus NCIMB 11891]